MKSITELRELPLAAYYRFDICDSTMNLAEDYLSSGREEFEKRYAPHNLVSQLSGGTDGAQGWVLFQSETQTRGRGQHGRSWVSTPAKGLYLSLLIPLWGAPKIEGLSLLVAWSLCKTLELWGLRPLLKWPNDILLKQDGELKKIAGILIESQTKGSVMSVCIGLGINVNAQVFPEGVPASTLEDALGREISRDEVLRAVVLQLKEDIDFFYEAGFGTFQRSVQERLLFLGEIRPVVFDGQQQDVRILGLAEDGALSVELLSGERKELYTCEIILDYESSREA